MNNLELQLAENLEFALEIKNKDKIEETFFIYNCYVSSMQNYNLEYNKILYENLLSKFQRSLRND